MSDVNRQMISLGIYQEHQTVILVILYQHHIFLCENINFRAKNGVITGSFALLLQYEEICS